MKKLPVVILLDSVRSSYNVGSIFRTADAVGAKAVICCGYTPYPHVKDDPRPRFEADKTTIQIAKTALGAELNMPCLRFEKSSDAVANYRSLGYQIVALEQAHGSKNLFNFTPKFPLVLTLGHEVTGHTSNLLKLADDIIEIPMAGQKESLNVSVAAGVALYQIVARL